ncbi:MAG TPA: aminotransferase class V-fold PLP-dependent enzyme, partial [Myxococcaceae bacterium]
MTYLDYNAGTPLHPQVAEFLAEAFRREPAGNPSSVHGAGRAARARLDAARARVARVVGRSAREVLFTASGSEACATAVLGLGRGGRLVTSAIEHPCVLLAAERRGTPVLQLRPGADGRIGPAAFEEALAGGAALCALQAANNETGVLQPADEVVGLARARGVATFVDAVQGPGRVSPASEADAVAYSAHKFGGPAGVGILTVRRGVALEPLVPGHQEGGLRGGTPAVVLCEAAALALELAEAERAAEVARLEALRARFERSVLDVRPGVRVHGAASPRLANT